MQKMNVSNSKLHVFSASEWIDVIETVFCATFIKRSLCIKWSLSHFLRVKQGCYLAQTSHGERKMHAMVYLI